MKKYPNIFPDYYKNGEDFIDQHYSMDKKPIKEFFSGDSVEIFNENLKTQPEDWHYRTKKVVYKINSMGYRTKEFDEIDWKNSIVIIGCSCTFGLGVDEEETLPHYLSLLTGRYVVNLGVIGASNQSMLDTSLILKKKYGNPYMLIMNWTSTARFPYYGFERIKHVGFWDRRKNDLESTKISQIFDSMYSEKSHEMITFRNILEATRSIWSDKTNYYECTFFPETDFYGKVGNQLIATRTARELIHPGYKDYEISSNVLHELIKDKL